MKVKEELLSSVYSKVYACANDPEIFRVKDTAEDIIDLVMRYYEENFKLSPKLYLEDIITPQDP